MGLTGETGFLEAPHLHESRVAEPHGAVAAEHRDALEQPVEARALDLDERVVRGFERDAVGDILVDEQQPAQGMGLGHDPEHGAVRQVPELLQRLQELVVERELALLPGAEIGLLREPALLAQHLDHLLMARRGREPFLRELPEPGISAVEEGEGVVGIEDRDGGGQLVQGFVMGGAVAGELLAQIDELGLVDGEAGDLGPVAFAALDRDIGDLHHPPLAADHQRMVAVERLVLGLGFSRHLIGRIEMTLGNQLAVLDHHVRQGIGFDGLDIGAVRPMERQFAVPHPDREGRGVEHGHEVVAALGHGGELVPLRDLLGHLAEPGDMGDRIGRGGRSLGASDLEEPRAVGGGDDFAERRAVGVEAFDGEIEAIEILRREADGIGAAVGAAETGERGNRLLEAEPGHDLGRANEAAAGFPGDIGARHRVQHGVGPARGIERPLALPAQRILLPGCPEHQAADDQADADRCPEARRIDGQHAHGNGRFRPNAGPGPRWPPESHHTRPRL